MLVVYLWQWLHFYYEWIMVFYCILVCAQNGHKWLENSIISLYK